MRSAALGLMIAAGIAATTKGMTVQASAMSNEPVNNPTSYTQEMEENVEKTDTEMMVEEAMQDENKSSQLYTGSSYITCIGDMTKADRAYEVSKISDGMLSFYDETSHTKVVPMVTSDGKGNLHTTMRTEVSYEYTEMNSFNLGVNNEKDSINLQPGSRFEEVSKKNGDYVELAEDGKTFVVYDASGKEIGTCKYRTVEEHDKIVKTATKIGVGVASAVGVAFAGEAIYNKKHS